jgi:tetratricopeptide (TPR) repeat protein
VLTRRRLPDTSLPHSRPLTEELQAARERVLSRQARSGSSQGISEEPRSRSASANLSLLANLANSLANKFDCTDNLPDLETAIEANQAAASAAPNDYPQRAEILANLSRARSDRAFHLGVSREEQGDVEGANDAYQQAIDSADEEAAPRTCRSSMCRSPIAPPRQMGSRSAPRH